MDADSWRQAKSVLEAALLCAPAEREAFVAGRCADAWLRKEVLACLNEHDESFLESALTISNTFEQASSSDDAEPAPEVLPGERIAGRYEIVRRLGAGGMGAVFLAKDTDLERQVALKFLIAAASAADVRSRIFHEARAAARITHSNIAVVHDVGVHEGRAFLVMEYVEGENLAQVLKRERPPLEKILAVGRQLASALAVAHEKGIIHRDLKPANIQIARDGSAKILDFGVAHAMASVDEPTGSAVTGAGTTLATLSTRTERGAIRHPGTPAYMSPEQMFGKPIDGRSDIYSLGVILYEMATGHRPYSTDDPLDVVLALSHKLLRPSGTETHLPEAVNDVIGKMLTVELDQRYQTATEAEEAILSLITPERAETTAPAPLLKRLFVVALKPALFVVAIPGVLTVLGFLTTTWFNTTLERARPFSNESPVVWLEMGYRSVFPLALGAGAVFFVIWALRFVVRMLRLSRRVDLLVTTGRTQTRQLSMRLSLSDPSVLGQAFSLIGLIALALIIWRFQNVLLAVILNFNRNPNAEALLGPLRPDNTADMRWYRLALDMLILVLGFGTAQVSHLRGRLEVRGGAGSLAVVSLMLAVSVLMAEFPYRLMWQNRFERISVAGDRCYAIGESAGEVLAYCPDIKPIRNRIVKAGEPSLLRTGIVESMFTARETSR
jgi:serine/threonine protein kinase